MSSLIRANSDGKHRPASHPGLRQQMAPMPPPGVEASRRVERLLGLQRLVRWDADVDLIARRVASLPAVELDKDRRARLLILSQELVRLAGEPSTTSPAKARTPRPAAVSRSSSGKGRRAA